MSIISVLGLAGAMFLLAITPGPGVLVTISRALASGFKYALIVVLGIVTGDLIFLLAAIYGLAAIADLLGNFFILIKYAGGIYLIWLGYKIWNSIPKEIKIKGIKELSFSENFISGFIITLGNPKVILFYLGFLPTFIDLSNLHTNDVIIVASVVSLILGSVMLSYAYTAVKAKAIFSSKKAEKNLNRVAGATMMSVGSLLILKN